MVDCQVSETGGEMNQKKAYDYEVEWKRTELWLRGWDDG